MMAAALPVGPPSQRAACTASEMPRGTRVAARRRLQDVIVACGLAPHSAVAVMTAAESYAKAIAESAIADRAEAV